MATKYLSLLTLLFTSAAIGGEWLIGIEITPSSGQDTKYHYYKNQKEIITNGVKRTPTHILENRTLWWALINFKGESQLVCNAGTYRVIKKIDAKKKEVIKGCVDDKEFKKLLKLISDEKT